MLYEVFKMREEYSCGCFDFSVRMGYCLERGFSPCCVSIDYTVTLNNLKPSEDGKVKKTILMALVSVLAFGLYGCGDTDEDNPTVQLTFVNKTDNLTIESVSVADAKVENLAPGAAVNRKIYAGNYAVKFTSGGVTVDASDVYSFRENGSYYIQGDIVNGSLKWTIFAPQNSPAADSVERIDVNDSVEVAEGSDSSGQKD